MTTRPEVVREDYAAAFDDYVVDHAEIALQAAYELGREAVRRELSVLDLATIHHDVLVDALARVADPAEVEPTARAAEEFFLESLSAFEMVRRGYEEAREAALLEHRQASVMRQLSSFLGDASLAVDAHDSLGEVLQLVAEHALEALDAESCTVRLSVNGGETRWAGEEIAEDGARLAVPLTSLDGRALGSVEAARRQGDFSELDEAILRHLAQMASAAIERAQLYAQTTGR